MYAGPSALLYSLSHSFFVQSILLHPPVASNFMKEAHCHNLGQLLRESSTKTDQEAI